MATGATHPNRGGPDARGIASVPVPGGPSASSKLIKWLTRASVLAVLLSLVAHLVVILVTLLVSVEFEGPAAAPSGDEVDFAVITEAELDEISNASVDTELLDVPNVQGLETVDLTVGELLEDGFGERLGEQSVDLSLDAGAGDIGEAGDLSRIGGSGGGGASFFGLEAQGNRFAYIVDISSSMRNNEKWDRTALELTRSITGLPETGEFLVVLYSSQAAPLGGRARWSDATERNKSEARTLIERVYPQGATEPLPAFDLVYSVGAKPDAIYFMTDGRFSTDIPSAVARLNRRYRIPIHCVLFGEIADNRVIREEVRDMMLSISRASGGRFTHVEETR